MAIDNVRLPEDVERGASGGPMFQTSIIALGNGSEQRNSDWAKQRAEYDISYGIDSKVDFSAVVRFFYARGGRARGFRFKDWADFEASNQIAVGNGAQTQFQLLKLYTSGAVTFQRIITKPVAGTVVVTVNGSPVTPTVDTSTGIITISPAPANLSVIVATFEFDVPVRFDVDKLSLEVTHFDAASIPSITLIELMDE